MKKIKIGYFADGPWSHKAFSKIINDKSLEIAFVVPRKKSQDKTLIGMANNNNIQCLKDADVNSKNFLEKLKKYNCDLFVSMSFLSRILQMLCCWVSYLNFYSPVECAW